MNGLLIALMIINALIAIMNVVSIVVTIAANKDDKWVLDDSVIDTDDRK